MHSNEFERRVQQQMEGFKLPPSDAVWQNVQEGIRRERRRRIWKYVPAAAALLLLVPGYLLFVPNHHPALKTTAEQSETGKLPSGVNSEKESQTAAVNPSNTKHYLNDSNLYTQSHSGSIDKNTDGKEPVAKDKLNEDAITASKASGIAATNTTNAKNEKNNSAVNTTKNSANPSLLANGNSSKNAAKHNAAGAHNPYVGAAVTGGAVVGLSSNSLAKNNSKHPDKTKHSNNNLNSSSEVNSTNVAEPSDNIVLVVPANDNVVIEEDLRHALVPGVAFNKAVNVSAPAIAIAQTKPITVQRHSSWSWGVQATPGLSNITKTYATTEKTMNAAMMSYASGPYNRGNSYVIPYPQPNNGASFNIGMFMKKAFRKTSVEVGVNYSYYSASVKVGAKTDSNAVVRLQDMTLLSANTFYQAGEDYTYHNKYHFIEVPVTFGFYMFHLGEAKVVGTVGGSFAYMVDGKMLFRNSYGTHFENKSLLNRTQVFVNAGIGVELNEKGKLPVTIGPVISYGVTRLSEPATSTGQHLISLGLKTSFQLQKLFR